MEGKWATNCPDCNARWQGDRATTESGGSVMCRSGHWWRWDEQRESESLGADVAEYHLWGDRLLREPEPA